MRRTWLLRGGAVAVIAVLLSAWALGVAGVGGSSSPTPERSTPASPESSSLPEDEPSTVLQRAKPRPSRGPSPSVESPTEPGSDQALAVEPVGDTRPPKNPVPPSDRPEPADQPPKPSNTPPPPRPPSPTPSQPDEACTDHGTVVDCALEPITGAP